MSADDTAVEFKCDGCGTREVASIHSKLTYGWVATSYERLGTDGKPEGKTGPWRATFCPGCRESVRLAMLGEEEPSDE